MTAQQPENIADEQFDVTLTGDEINHLLKAVGTATSIWAKNRRQCPTSINLDVLTAACNKVAYSIDRPYTPAPETCIWSEDENGAWDTECGNKFELMSGEAPWRQGIKFCPYCGKSLRQAGEQ
jgi:hypothetical protein